ncbi:MAG: right-handed parallel beta-helix repeat-containing protein, partial [Geobacteraceae bacterium]|nr:right-handed parallel beta-helix repeat-containing protein [Geobacteraceae bacterium]
MVVDVIGDKDKIHRDKDRGPVMKSSFSASIRLAAVFTLLIFSSNQIIFAAGVNPYEPYQTTPVQPTTEVTETAPEVTAASPTALTTTDFLSGQNSPLSAATVQDAPSADPNKTYDADGTLRKEISPNGTAILHVYEGELIQSVIDGAQSGDTVYLHAGTYHEHIVLKSGVSISGESKETTILNGDYVEAQDVIRALGGNRIENLTITGGGPWNGETASSAVKISGDNVKVRNNRVLDNQDYGIYIEAGNNILVEGNFVKDTQVGVQLPKAGTTIRYNTFVSNVIGVNILHGGTPVVENNIFTNSMFQSVFEYAYGQNPTRGYATVRNNTFFNNTERGSYYGSATPPAAESETSGNQKTDPLFIDPANGNYAVSEASAAYGRGGFLPEELQFALDRASLVQSRSGATFAIEELRPGGLLTGWRFAYSEGSVEEFYRDGTRVLDTTPPVIAFVSQNLTRQSSYTLSYTSDGIDKSETRTLTEGDNALSVTAEDIFGNTGSASFNVLLDQTPPQGSISVNSGAQYTNSQSVILNLSADDAGSGVTGMSFSTDNVHWSTWEGYSASKTLNLSSGDGVKTIYVKYFDRAGNESDNFSKAITLDTVVPTGSFSINDNASQTTAREVALTLTGSDALSGIGEMRFSLDGGSTWTAWEAIAAST